MVHIGGEAAVPHGCTQLVSIYTHEDSLTGLYW